jgi:hypothetical protein
LFDSIGAEQSDEIWFHNLAAPQSISSDNIGAAATNALMAIKGKNVAGDAFDMLETGDGPRMVFISLGIRDETARVVYSGGADFPQALANALKLLQQLELPKEKIENLKLDLVYQIGLIKNFHAQKTPVPAPGLRGIAFSPKAQFAFLPEQLLFNSMYLNDGRLNVTRLGELLLHRENYALLGALKQILLYDGTQPLFVFSTQSVFANGVTTILLHHGHRWYRDLDRDDLNDALRKGVSFLLKNCNSRGWFPVEPEPWTPDFEDTHSAGARAHVALALAKYAELANHAPSRAAAVRIIGDLQNEIKPVSSSKKINAVVDFFRADLKANAVATLACLELVGQEDVKPKQELMRTALELGRFLLYQMQPDGMMLTNRFHPAGDFNIEFSTDASAAAATALFKLYAATKDMRWLHAAKQCMQYILTNEIENKNLEQFPDAPWMLTALDTMFTYDRDQKLLDAARKMALALTFDRDTAPPLPDLCGSFENRRTTTAVAALTPHLVNAASLFRSTNIESMARDLDAAITLNLIFQLQPQLRAESAMYMPNSKFFGAFRDDIRTSKVSLATQALQTLSLVNVLDAIKRPANPMRLKLDDFHKTILDAE